MTDEFAWWSDAELASGAEAARAEARRQAVMSADPAVDKIRRRHAQRYAASNRMRAEVYEAELRRRGV